MQVKELESILKGSFEAGLLIDDAGSLLHVNATAQALLGIQENSPASLDIDQHVIFFHNHITVPWEAIATVSHTNDVSAMCIRDGSSFRAVARLISFESGHVLVYIRPSTAAQERSLAASMVEASLDPVFQIDQSGMILMVNSAACRLFGWAEHEFLGNNISMIVGAEHAGSHDGYMKRYLETNVAHVMGKKRQLPARCKDGSEFMIELSVVEIKTNDKHVFCGFVRDLSDVLAWEASMEYEKNRMSGIVDAALDPLFQINEKGVIQMVNKAATTQFGWTKEEFVGNNISMIVGAKHADKHDQYLERYLKTGVTRVMGSKRELPARRKDGSEFLIQLSLVEVAVEEGQERIFCGFILDLTEQKEHINEIKRRESFTNKIIEGSHDALIVTNKDGLIQRVNEAAATKFQSASDVMCTLTIFSLLSPDDAAWLQGEMQNYLSAGIPMPNAPKEVEAVRPNGDTFPISIGVSELEGPKGETFFAVYVHDLTERKRLTQIEIEKSAAELLLLNMLPEAIAGRLINDPSHIAESHSFAAVLFADIVGFTSMSSTMEPREVVAMLNELFSAFDELVDKYDLNKVKTIGDCYMVTSVPGIVEDEVEHCRRLCHFALDMIEALQAYNSEEREKKLDLRVGINCGPVVAGVVGTKRFLYDLWGDAVNLASRMESTGVPGRIQTTSHVVEMMSEDFTSEYRGIVNVKGKGEMDTYFLTGRKKPSAYQRPVSPIKSPEEKAIMLIRRQSSSLELLQSLKKFEIALTEVAEADEDDGVELLG